MSAAEDLKRKALEPINEPRCRHVPPPLPHSVYPPDPHRCVPKHPDFNPHHHDAMCRFVIYKGTEPVQLSHLLTRPCHSIINQAFDSRLRLDHRRPINGDGFGVGEYSDVKTSARQVPIASLRLV